MNRMLQACALVAAFSPAAAGATAGPPDPAATTQSAAGSASVAGEQVFDVALANGANQRVLYAEPPSSKGVIVMLPGGSGVIGIGRTGTLRHADNFVVRTRRLWVARGYAVLIPDSVDGKSLRGRRSALAYAGVVDALVVCAHARRQGPVFLLGTSQGAIAAMNGAAHLSAQRLAGVVLTESVSRQGGSHETVFDASPGGVRVPALVVANRDDRCVVAPPGDAPRIAAAMSGAAQVGVLRVHGGTRRDRDDCGSLSPHGYYGIEAQVVARIADWMDGLAH